MTVAASESCSICGTVLLDGKCARCLLTYALDAGDEGPAEMDGWRFGDYFIEGRIARGGMGVVYRAQQISLNRPVAIKMIIGGELASTEAVRRFRIEAEAAAKLRHPNIVAIYDVGEFDHEHFYAMELVEGGSLAEQTSWEAKAAAALIAKVARALAYAHEHGVLHRDLKPSNILIDTSGEPKLADFGLAKFVAQDQGLTLSQAMLGSPGYMAPEQAKQGDVTTAADVYGLGAVLYELLAGRPPFAGGTAVETLRSVMDDEPPPLPKSVPRDLATICLKCLDKSPAGRYASARELADDCESFIRGDTILARPVSQAEAVLRWMRRRPMMTALIAATVVTGCTGVSGILWQWRRAEQAREGLHRAFTQLEWRRTVQQLNESDRSLGLALLARMLRQDPGNARAASLAISALEQSNLATPAAPSIVHGKGIVILHARLSPDARRVLTVGADDMARLWDATTSAPLGQPMHHTGIVRWAEFSPDGERVLTASDDGTARLWNGRTGEPLSGPFLHEGPVTMVKFAREKFITISEDGTARLWPGGAQMPLGGAGRWVVCLDDGSRIFTCSPAGVQCWNDAGEEVWKNVTDVRGLALNPDGTKLAGWSAKGLHVWNVEDGSEQVGKFEQATSLLHATWSPDGKTLAGASEASWARIWDAATGEPLTTKLWHVYGCEFVTFSPDGSTLMSGGDDGKARLWNATTGAPVFLPLNHSDGVLWAEYSRDGTHLLTTSRPWGITKTTHGMGEVQMWDLRHRGKSPWRFRAAAGSAGSAWSSDGRLCTSCSHNGDVHVLDPATRQVLHGPWKNDGWSRAIAFMPGDRSVALVTGKGELNVWSLETNDREIGPIQVGSTEAGRFSRDGLRLLIGHTDGQISVWDMQKGELVCRPPSHHSPINGLAFSPDDRYLATGGEEGLCFVSDAFTGKQLFPAIRHDNQIVSVQFSPDGKWLVTSCHDRTARMWNAFTGEPRGEPMRHRGEVAYAEFSPDGARVLTACRDGTTRLWDARTGSALIEPMMHTSALRGASFSRDARRIVTEDHDGLRLWEGATGEPLTVLQHQTTGRGIGYNAQGLHVSFSPDGQSVVHGIASQVTIVWNFPEVPVPTPWWLPELLETMAATKVNPANGMETVHSSAWMDLRSRLQALPGDDFYASWARQFCAEPE